MFSVYVVQLQVTWRVHRDRFVAECVYRLPKTESGVRSMVDHVIRRFVQEIMPGFDIGTMKSIKVTGEGHELKGQIAHRMDHLLNQQCNGVKPMWCLGGASSLRYGLGEDNRNGL